MKKLLFVFASTFAFAACEPAVSVELAADFQEVIGGATCEGFVSCSDGTDVEFTQPSGCQDNLCEIICAQFGAVPEEDTCLTIEIVTPDLEPERKPAPVPPVKKRGTIWR